jgi:hypothetical protein
MEDNMKVVIVGDWVFGPFSQEEAERFVQVFRETWRAKLVHGVGKVPAISIATVSRIEPKEAVQLLWPPPTF